MKYSYIKRLCFFIHWNQKYVGKIPSDIKAVLNVLEPNETWWPWWGDSKHSSFDVLFIAKNISLNMKTSETPTKNVQVKGHVLWILQLETF